MKHKILDLTLKTRISASNLLFGSKAKMCRFFPNIFEFFIIFLVVCHFLLKNQKKNVG